MKKLKLILPILLLAACSRTPKDDGTKPADLFPQPQTVAVNTDGGYITNVVTGDSIKPIILESGDTLITGKPIPAIGKVIHPDSVAKPKSFKVNHSQLTTKNAHPNRHKIPKELTVIPVNKDSLKRVKIPKIAANDTTHYILNSTGQKVKTGVPVKIQGKKVKAIQPQATKALPPATKDAAIANIQYLDVDQGMSSSYVLCVYEDKRGNLWFGTSGGGVSKYDGETFSHFTEKEGFSNNIVFSILEDQKGSLWFGTDGDGVSKYDGETFIHFTEKEGFSNNYVMYILEDQKGNLWFGTDGGGVSMYNGESFIHFTEKEGLSNNYVLSILEDKSGNLWFGINGGGVSMYNGESFVHFTEKEGLSDDRVLAILEDKSGNLWFGTFGGGVSMYNGESFIHFTEKEGLSNNIVFSIEEDKIGNLWFGTYGGGVSRLVLSDAEGCNGEYFVLYSEKEGLSNNIIRSILEDKSGNLWFGTSGGGVSMYNGESFIHFTEKEGLSNNYVLSILEDKSGNLWFGINGGGVSMYNGENFIHFTEKEGLSNNNVLSILEDKNGNLWFGTLSGGVSMYTGESFIHFTEKEGLSNNRVWSILEDKSGNLWFGTDGGGVSKFDGETFIHFTEKEGLSNNIVRSILEDKSGNIWLGTYGGGVSVYNGESFVHYSEKEGLSNNIVRSILEDNQNNLWVSTEKGLNDLVLVGGDALSLSKGADSVPTPLEKESKKVTFSIKNFGKQDGLKGLDFFANSAFIDSKNRAWWGSGKCLEMLDLNTFKPSEKIPQPFLKQLDVNEQFIDYRNITDSLGNDISFNGVQKFENYPLNLELPYHKNHLTFHFAAIDWAAPHKIRYSYRMLGLEQNWSQANKEAKAEYRNLPYGTYVFQIKAIGESGKWSEPFEYTFTITPPWWHTWWARALYAIFALILILALIKWRTAALKQRQKELETEVDNATKEIREQKDLIEIKQLETEKQKELIEEKHKEITDSINYAERIQRSFLATSEMLDKNLKDYFVFFRPKDVVSGDFYWAAELNNGNFAFSCADSTGHGVPGAIMSILNISSLEKSVEKETEPHIILYQTRRIIIDRLKKDGSEEGGKDGMDCSLLVIDKDKTQLSFAAANNPVFIVRPTVIASEERTKQSVAEEEIASLPTVARNDENGSVARNDDYQLFEYKPDKMPVGKHDKENEPFTLHTLPLQKGDIIYALTDGFPDQFGGEKSKKYMIKNLKNLLLQIAHLPMPEQEQKLAEEFTSWKGSNEQVDDVCVIGVRI
jgi:ligand-binding sensor domain-containing protein/serine phosphatase RsbU (regulator of sigma subunit)